jgi:hypothetical protein
MLGAVCLATCKPWFCATRASSHQRVRRLNHGPINMKVPISINQSVSVLDGGDLVEKAYHGLLSLMDMIKPRPDNMIAVQRYAGGGGRSGQVMHLTSGNDEAFTGILSGVYMPGVKRDYWCGNFDVGVDEFPKEGCVYCAPNAEDGETFVFVNVRQLGGFGKHIVTQCHNPVARYRVSHIAYMENGSPLEWEEGAKIRTRVAYFAIDNSGGVWACHDLRKLREINVIWAVRDDDYQSYHWGPGALSLLADRRFLWLVETEESLGIEGASRGARMQFGVDPEMVKSLFYSRTEPMTASGRLRPILHWVESHKRRIEKGVEVDVVKHLRGIESFQMGGLRFNITSPVKTPAKVMKEAA